MVGREEAPPPNGPLGCLASDAGTQSLPVNGTCLCVRVYLWHGCMLGVYLFVSVSVCPCTYMPVWGTWERGPGLPLLGPGACGHTS